MYNCYVSCVGAMVSIPVLQALEAEVSRLNPAWVNFYFDTLCGYNNGYTTLLPSHFSTRSPYKPTTF